MMIRVSPKEFITAIARKKNLLTPFSDIGKKGEWNEYAERFIDDFDRLPDILHYFS